MSIYPTWFVEITAGEVVTIKIFQQNFVEKSWYWKVRGKGRRGISFDWRQHRFFFVEFFFLLALSYGKLEETGNEKEWEHRGGVRLTEVDSPQHCACDFFWTFTNGTYQERSLRRFIFPWTLNALTSTHLVQRRNVPLPRTLLWHKLAGFYGLSAPLRIFRLRESSCGQ